MANTSDIDLIKKVNELGLTEKQRGEVDKAVARSRRNLVATATGVGVAVTALWAVIAWFGIDQSMRDRGIDLVTNFVNGTGANLVADRLLDEPGLIAETLRGGSLFLEGPFSVTHSNAGRSERDIEGSHDFCFLSYVRSVSPECTCFVQPVTGDASSDEWRMVANIESFFTPIADEHACGCRAYCVSFRPQS